MRHNADMIFDYGKEANKMVLYIKCIDIKILSSTNTNVLADTKYCFIYTV